MAINHVFKETDDFYTIVTPVSNITTRKIGNNISAVDDYGINGGFFNSSNGYSNPPTEALSIGWSSIYGDHGSTNAYGNKSRGTVVIFEDYFDNYKLKGGILRATSITDVKNQLGQNHRYKAMIGGGSLSLGISSNSTWKDSVFSDEDWSGLYPNLALTNRTCLGLKNSGSETYAFLAISRGWKSLYACRDYLKSEGCFDGIFLDGSGSSQMRCLTNNNVNIYVNNGDGRKIWNIVTLISKS
ncbi:phosphodiester glycosidase family protein [Paenibacillus sp. YN15]|uniref:phosphodiester glycosidase family protein n=1 Tax=Paenibacillus sp. YN15 TaxID=1742774 RepID=UPI000DCF1A8A|nr:phosphodiester glycosidase family protein [Paenibacillus sp. YN15]RAV05491.1 hypothetical protein DQG13_02385 [Paenibacillus sp. YN15]